MKSILFGFLGAAIFHILFVAVTSQAIDLGLPGSWVCSLGPYSLNCPQHPSAGGELIIKESGGQGSNYFSLKVPDSGLSTDKQVVLNADGTLPSTAFVNTGSNDSCTSGYKYACVPN